MSYLPQDQGKSYPGYENPNQVNLDKPDFAKGTQDAPIDSLPPIPQQHGQSHQPYGNHQPMPYYGQAQNTQYHSGYSTTAPYGITVSPPGKALGIVSLVMSLIPEILLIAIFLLAGISAGNGGGGEGAAVLIGILIILSLVALAPLSLILGIIGVCVRQSSGGKVMSGIAIAISAINGFGFIALMGVFGAA